MLAIGGKNITLGPSASITLRPNLRSAIRVHREFGGFDKAIEDIIAGNVTVMMGVIRECSEDPLSLAAMEKAYSELPLFKVVADLKLKLAGFVLTVAYESEQSDEPQSDAKTLSFEEYHNRLYHLGTGWLGWSPEQTYSATASEIEQALKGRVDFLSTVIKAVFGDAKSTEPDSAEQSPEVFNAKLSAVLAFASARLAANPQGTSQ